MKRLRNRSGTSLAELPVNLWVFIFFLVLPFIDFVTFGYRTALAYWGLRDAVTKAAFQQAWSPSGPAPGAANTFTNTLNADAAAWTGISYTSNQLSILQVDPSQTVNTLSGPLASGTAIDPNSVYLLRGTATAAVQPLFSMSGFSALGTIPGLTAPMNLTFTYQVADENPQGLVSGGS